MAEKPILFNGEMVRAILAGKKTQTRRVVKLPSSYDFCDFNGLGNAVFTEDCQTYKELKCPYVRPGDCLWVREKFRLVAGEWPYWHYPADDSIPPLLPKYVYSEGDTGEILNRLLNKKGFSPSIHMPRIASRILLEVVNVRVERVQDISEDDTFVEELCRLNGVEELAITGDSYGVPPLTDKVATLVQKLGGNVPDDYEFYPTPNDQS